MRARIDGHGGQGSRAGGSGQRGEMQDRRGQRAPSRGGSSRRRPFRHDLLEARPLEGRILCGIVDGAPRPHLAGLALAVALGAIAAKLDAAARDDFFERVVEAAHTSAQAWEVTLIRTQTVH